MKMLGGSGFAVAEVAEIRVLGFDSGLLAGQEVPGFGVAEVAEI